MGKRKERSLKQKLEAAWQDNKCRSPNGSVRWLIKQTHVRHLAADDLFYCPVQKRGIRKIRKLKLA